jgi:hypothetical protein
MAFPFPPPPPPPLPLSMAGKSPMLRMPTPQSLRKGKAVDLGNKSLVESQDIQMSFAPPPGKGWR